MVINYKQGARNQPAIIWLENHIPNAVAGSEINYLLPSELDNKGVNLEVINYINTNLKE